jgi:hypothetical protein
MSYTKNSDIVFPVQGREKNVGNSDPLSGTFAPNGIFTSIRTVRRSLTGNRLPNWRTKIENGENATTSMSAVLETLDFNSIPKSSPVFERWLYTGDGVTRWCRVKDGDWFIRNQDNEVLIEQPEPTIDESFVDNLARARFYAKLKSETRKFQGLVFLGELGETLHMLRRPAFGLQKLVKDFVDTLKKRKRSAPKQWKKNIGELWLEQSFGWNPLIADSRDAVNAYKTLTDPGRQKSTRVSVGSSKYYDTSSGLPVAERPGYLFNGAFPVTCVNVSARKIEQVLIRYKAAVHPQVVAPTWGTNMALFGFSPQEFVPALWELLPWSFLVDYFTNVGEILDSYTTVTPEITYVNRTRIRRVWKQILRNFVRSDAGKPGVGWIHDGANYGNPGFVRTFRKEVTRSADVGISPPTFQMNFNLTDGQLLNVAALLSQVSTDLAPQSKPRRWHR